MIDIGTGASDEKNALAAVEAAIRQAKTKKVNKEKIDLALVFYTPDLTAASIIKIQLHCFQTHR